VVQIAEELVYADAGVIALLDEESGLITYPYLHNVPLELSEVRVPRGEGLAGRVMTDGRPTVIDDYSTYPGAVDAFVGAGLASVVAAPIASGDRVFGTLLVFSLRERRAFSARDMALIAGVGRQAGIAIENAHLYENLRYYVGQVTRAQEDERRRIARELHDDTAQSLALISRRLDTLAPLDVELREPYLERIARVRELTTQTLQDVRRFSRDLRPSTLDDLGLLPALEGLTADVAKRNEIEARLDVVGDQRRLPAETELVLFRVTQEALRNVEKHSHAGVVEVTVEFRETAVKITVSDDGEGFRLSEGMDYLLHTGKLGLVGMRERAQLLGGTLAIESEPGRGTTVVVDVPTQEQRGR